MTSLHHSSRQAQPRGPLTYADAARILAGAGGRTQVKLSPGTILMHGSEGRIHVVHDRTAIITFHPSGMDHPDNSVALALPEDGPIAPVRERLSKFLQARGGKLRDNCEDPRAEGATDWTFIPGEGRPELVLISGAAFSE